MKRLLVLLTVLLIITGCSTVEQERVQEPELVQGTVVTDVLINQIVRELQDSRVFADYPFQISRNDQNEIVCHVISDHHPFLIYDPEQDSFEINFTVTSLITTNEQGIIEQRILELICDGNNRGCTAKVTDHEKTRLWPVDEPEEGVSEQLANQVKEKRDRIDFEAVKKTAEQALFEIRKITLNTQEYTYQKLQPYACATEGFETEKDTTVSFFEQQWEILMREENRGLLLGWMSALERDPLEGLCLISEQYLCEDTGACYNSRNDSQINVPSSLAEQATALYLKDDLMDQALYFNVDVDLSVRFESEGVLYDGLSDPRYVILKETENRDESSLQPVLISRTENIALMTALIPCEDPRFGMSENGSIVVLDQLEETSRIPHSPFPLWEISLR